jgi:hypothetical protein
VSPPWPCSTCGAPGVRNVFARGYCAAHLSELYCKFSAEVWALDGIGLQSGARRPDHGPEMADLTCVACGAGWVGPLGERCSWCIDAAERQRRWQAEMTLTPPEVDPADRTYDDRMKAWAQRLERAVKAGLIDRDRADRAWRRAVTDERRAA